MSNEPINGVHQTDKTLQQQCQHAPSKIAINTLAQFPQSQMNILITFQFTSNQNFANRILAHEHNIRGNVISNHVTANHQYQLFQMKTERLNVKHHMKQRENGYRLKDFHLHGDGRQSGIHHWTNIKNGDVLQITEYCEEYFPKISSGQDAVGNFIVQLIDKIWFETTKRCDNFGEQMFVEQALDQYENGASRIAQNEHVGHDDVGATKCTAMALGVQLDFTWNAKTNANNSLSEYQYFGDDADVWFDLGIVAAGIEWRQTEYVKSFQIFWSRFNEVHVWCGFSRKVLNWLNLTDAVNGGPGISWKQKINKIFLIFLSSFLFI